jgi:hypothetical protein
VKLASGAPVAKSFAAMVTVHVPATFAGSPNPQLAACACAGEATGEIA